MTRVEQPKHGRDHAPNGSDPIPGFNGAPSLLYYYAVAGSDKASIDTNSDGTYAGAFSQAFNVLQLFVVARTTSASAIDTLELTLNNDTGAHYDREVMSIINATGSFGPTLADTSWKLGVHGSGGSANYAGIQQMILPGYSSRTFYQPASLAVNGTNDGTAGNNLSGVVTMTWRSTAAVTRMKFAGSGGELLKVGSQVWIYGF